MPKKAKAPRCPACGSADLGPNCGRKSGVQVYCRAHQAELMRLRRAALKDSLARQA